MPVTICQATRFPNPHNEFYVLLTVPLGSVLVNNQLDAQFFFRVYLFKFFTFFEHPCAHHQENQLYQYDIWYMSLYVGDRLVRRFGCSIQTCTPDKYHAQCYFSTNYDIYQVDTKNA